MSGRARLALCAAAIAPAALASCTPNAQRSASTTGVERAVRAYVAAVDAGDGRRVCREMAAGALSGFVLPKRDGPCASSMKASIGYRDPRGYPVWRHTRIERFRSVNLQGSTARATVTVKTTFADNREPSIEDDVVYLTRGADGWRIAKPSATLYRAIGASSPPLSAFRAPTGG